MLSSRALERYIKGGTYTVCQGKEQSVIRPCYRRANATIFFMLSWPLPSYPELYHHESASWHSYRCAGSTAASTIPTSTPRGGLLV